MRRARIDCASATACLLAIGLGLGLGATSAGANTLAYTEEHEIHLEAQEVSYDQPSDTFSGEGGVLIRRGNLQLIADEVRVSRSPNEADARGNVELTTPDGVFFADHIYFNLDDETGFLRNVSIQSADSRFSLFGTYAEKRSGQCYRIENGEFTTCRCPDGPPTWTIASERLDLDVGGYGTVRRASFNLYRWPVVYLPWAIFPVSNERQSGLLEPRVGFSNRRGLQILQPAYWAINKSHDATIAFDIESSARLGLVAEHRYSLSRNVRGQWTVTYFNEVIRGSTRGLSVRSRIPENRWSWRAEHEHREVLGGTLYADAFLVGDDGFLREINAMSTDYTRDVALRTLQFTDSRLGFVRSWNRFLLKFEGRYYQDIDLTGIVEPSVTPAGDQPSPAPTPRSVQLRRSSETLQRLPSLETRGQGRLTGPLLGDLSASLVEFQRGEGTDGLRLDIEPSLTIPLPVGPYAFGSVQGSVRETAYHLFQRAESSDVRLSQNPTRETFSLRAQVGTALARTYPVRWRTYDALHHIVEPRAEYSFIPDVAQANLPMFDDRDRARPRNLFTYGLSTGLLARSSGADDEESKRRFGQVRELARLWILQSVDAERRVPSIAANSDRDDHLSDIDIGGAVSPIDGLSIDAATQLDHGAGDLTAARVGIFVEDWRYEGPARAIIRSRARISYRFLTGNALQEVHGDMLLRVTSWLGLAFATRYDVVENTFLDRHFGIRALSQCDCWALDFGITDRTNPSEIEARIRFTLLGLTDAGFFESDANRAGR